MRDAPGRGVGGERDLVMEAHRQGATVAAAQVEVEHLGLDLAGMGGQRGQQRRAVAGQDVGEPQPA